VAEHSSPGLWHRWPRRNPAVGVHRNPLGMDGGRVWFELHHLLLLRAHQPAFTAWLFRWFVGGAVSRQAGGATATEDSSAKRVLPERCPDRIMASPIMTGGPNRARTRWDCQGMNRVSWMAMEISVEKHHSHLFDAPEKKLFSVKKPHQRSFWRPWIATNVPSRQENFACPLLKGQAMKIFLVLNEKT